MKRPPQWTHCGFCGAAFEARARWPRTCAACQEMTFLNPAPVAVAVQPVGAGLLVIRRGVSPRRGELALPGGYVDVDETWEEACARELFEETGVVTQPAALRLLRVASAGASGRYEHLVVFGLAPRLSEADLPAFSPGVEVLERLVLTGTQPLAFPLHTEIAAEFFAGATWAAPRH